MARRVFRFVLVALSTAALSSGQHFERLHSMLPDREALQGVVADFDGDGDLDSVFRLTGQELHVNENDGTGLFRWRLRGTAAADPGLAGTAIVSDVDQDLDSDLIFPLFAGYPGATNVPWLLFHNDGAGGFTDASALVPSGPRYGGIRVADLNADGFPDVYGFDSTVAGSPDLLWLGDGSGGFVDASALLPALDSVAAEPFDFDGDGDTDVLTQPAAGALVLLESNGSSFTPTALPTLVLHGPLERVHDVDEDGLLDIVSYDYDIGGATIGYGDRWNENLGNGQFGPLRSIVSLPNLRSTLVFVDWTGDGKQDALAIDQDPDPFILAYNLRAYRGNGAGSYTLVSQPVLEEYGGTGVFGDWDGDGDTDLSAGVPIWSGGEGAFGAAHHPPEPGSYDELSLQDVDGDADLDLLATQTNHTDFFLSRNDGTGGFGPLTTVLPNAQLIAWTALDLHGDGDTDLLAAGDSFLVLLESDGSGGWTYVPAGLPSLPNFPANFSTADFESGDFNGDGIDDSFICLDSNLAFPKSYLLLGDGAGGLIQGVGTGQSSFERAEAGDLDGDGDLDLVVVVQPTSVRSYRNSGSGALTWVGGVLAFQAEPEIELVDLTGDGTLELVVYEDLSVSSRRFSIFESDGNGFFSTTPTVVVPLDPSIAARSSDIVPVDFDQDGALDLLFSEGYLYRNQGGLAFEDVSGGYRPPFFPTTNGGRPIASGDLDIDGDVDIWFGSPSEIHWNIRRQVAWRTWPKVGKRLVMDVYGSPFAPWILLGSSALANLPTSWGLLRLDLSQAFAVGPALLDAAGRGEATFAVPKQASLYGATFYWQALVGAPLLLCNVETTVLSGF